MAILIVLGRGTLIASRGTPPEVHRAPAHPAARGFVYFFALAPIVGDGLVLAVHPPAGEFMAAPLVVMSGLAVIVAAGERIKIEHQYLIGYAWARADRVPPLVGGACDMIQPWTFAADLRIGRPADEMGQFFGDSFARRTGRPLAVVAGDQALASLVALGAPSRPSLYLEEVPDRPLACDEAGHRRQGRGDHLAGHRQCGPTAAGDRAGVSRSGGRGAAGFRAAISGPYAADADRLGDDPAARAGHCVRSHTAAAAGSTGAAG